MIRDCGHFNHSDKEAAILKSEVCLVVYKIDNRHIYADIDGWLAMVSSLSKG